MTINIDILPDNPPKVWNKPTLTSTKGGKTYIPTHPDLFKVEFTSNIPQLTNDEQNGSIAERDEESFSSRLVACRDFEPNQTITKLSNLSKALEKAYSSVQYGMGKHDHFELNSDLLFMNHSCSPSVYVVLPNRNPLEWCVKTGPKGLRKGEDITFFYPSTEWDMAQGFECSCGSKDCLGKIRGAKYISMEQLEKRGYINDHIRTLKAQQQEDDSQ